jgi:hypothetical protein
MISYIGKNFSVFSNLSAGFCVITVKPPRKWGNVEQLNNDVIMNAIVEILVPLGVCVALPVLIVWLVVRARQNDTNRRAEVMLKAIEMGVPVDPDLFKTKKAKGTIKEGLLEKLTGACITSLMGVAFLVCTLAFPNLLKGWGFAGSRYLPFAGAVLLAVGIGLFISYFAGKKMLAKEIEAEEKKLSDGKE